MTDSEPPDRDLETRLIRAGMRETPPSGTLQRTLAGLGLGASAVATAGSAGALGATKAAAPLTAFVVAKWASIGAASGLMLTAATYGLNRATPAEPRLAPSALPARAASDAPALAASTAASEALVVESSSPPAPPAAAPAAAPKSATRDAELRVPLAAELAFVDRARVAFQRNDAGTALALLAGYERAFPELRLMPEVLYLRMQAHVQHGAPERAVALAERLAREFPHSPHASSARSILRETSAR